MVAVRCQYCQSEKLVKDGFSPKGKQRYRCRGCGKRSRENPTPPGSDMNPQREAEILAALNERMSQRGIARTFGISRNTVAKLLKKR